MKKSNIIIIIIAAVLAVALCFCYYILHKTNRNDDISPTAGISGNTYPMVVKDALGDSITIEKRPERIISLAPGTTEILFAVGSGNRVVGVSSYCHYPPEVEELPRVGDYVTPNIEKITALKPDLIVGQRGNDRKVLTKLKSLGFNAISVDPVSFDSLITSIDIIGKITEGKERANLISTISTLKNSYTQKSAEESKKKPQVLFLFSPDGTLYSAGVGTIIDEMITIAGGENIAKDTGTAWPQLTMELVTAKNPDIIIITEDAMYQDPKPIEEIIKNFKKDAKWKNIAAVKNGNIYLVNGNNVNILGPRLINGLEEFYKVLEKHRK